MDNKKRASRSRKRRVAISTGSPAEFDLVRPVHEKLRETPHLRELAESQFLVIEPGEDTATRRAAAIARRLRLLMPDVLLVPADRVEQVPVAMVAYYMRIPVFHLFAGAGATGTYDDLNRRVISSFAYLLLCEDQEARRRLLESGEEAWRIQVVGATHFDGMGDVDESLVPRKKGGTSAEPQRYDVVLINPNPADRQDEVRTITAALHELDERVLTYWIEANDPYSGEVVRWLRRVTPNLANREQPVVFIPHQPRPKFLGLVMNARRFITNSSSAVYEVPILGRTVQTINPGLRNLGRSPPSYYDFTSTAGGEPPKMKRGAASEKVADLLARYPLEESKLRKPYYYQGQSPL